MLKIYDFIFQTDEFKNKANEKNKTTLEKLKDFSNAEFKRIEVGNFLLDKYKEEIKNMDCGKTLNFYKDYHNLFSEKFNFEELIEFAITHFKNNCMCNDSYYIYFIYSQLLLLDLSKNLYLEESDVNNEIDKIFRLSNSCLKLYYMKNKYFTLIPYEGSFPSSYDEVLEVEDLYMKNFKK